MCYGKPAITHNGYRIISSTSIFIGLEGRFAEWAGSILSFNQTIILVTEIGKEKLKKNQLKHS